MSEKKISDKWIEAGFVSINSGEVVIMDAIDAAYQGGEELREHYDKLEGNGWKEDEKELDSTGNFRRFKWKLTDSRGREIESEALISHTGYGDGYYRIWARVNEEGRVAELRINFETTYGYDDDSKKLHDVSQRELMDKVWERQLRDQQQG